MDESVVRWAKDDAEPAQVQGSVGENIENKTKKKSAVAKKAKQNLESLAEQEVSKKTACNREEKQAAGSKQKAAEVCGSEDTEALKRMKRTMSEDCSYVPGSYKEARLKFLAKTRKRGYSHSEACKLWNESAARASWLDGLSLNELKRRRFI